MRMMIDTRTESDYVIPCIFIRIHKLHTKLRASMYIKISIHFLSISKPINVFRFLSWSKDSIPVDTHKLRRNWHTSVHFQRPLLSVSFSAVIKSSLHDTFQKNDNKEQTRQKPEWQTHYLTVLSSSSVTISFTTRQYSKSSHNLS